MISLFRYLPLLLAVLLFGCTPNSQTGRSTTTEGLAKAYFETYQQRADWDKLLSFYREDIQFEDVLLDYQANGIGAFKAFYNWPDPGFDKMSADQPHLELESLVANDSIAVGRGNFNPFYWHGELQEWDDVQFTIWLYFDDKGKIYKQLDVINYPEDVLAGAGWE